MWFIKVAHISFKIVFSRGLRGLRGLRGTHVPFKGGF
jgi:hypothetical protein